MRNVKEMKELSHLPKFGRVVKEKKGTVKSHGGTVGSVDVSWHQNSLAKRDQVFKLEVGDEVAYIDFQELYHYIRAINSAIDIDG